VDLANNNIVSRSDSKILHIILSHLRTYD
jgi:hypothetical protein